MAPGPASRPDATLVGVTMIVASVLMISFGDAVVKWISADLTLWQIFVTRSLLAIPLCLLVLGGFVRLSRSVRETPAGSFCAACFR